MDTASLPPGTAQEWAARYVAAESLAVKFTPPPPGMRLAEGLAPLRLARPGRPSELRVTAKTKRSLTEGQLAIPRRRAQLLHTFLHHELQAAELMCWALLAFPETPRTFRRGLLAICADEVRHMARYRALLEGLGCAVGDFPVRDWFWQRVATCATPVQFVALLGLGLEGGNLDHAARFAARFAAVGDHEAARAQEEIGRDEERHVRFAALWFRRFTGGLDFARWRAELPAPLTPTILRGPSIDRAARARAGLPPAFLDALEAS